MTLLRERCIVCFCKTRDIYELTIKNPDELDFYENFESFLNCVDEEGDWQKNVYIDYLQNRMPESSRVDEKNAIERAKKWIELYISIKEEGIKKPIMLIKDPAIIDGYHRLAIALHLGIEKIKVINE